MARAVAWCVIIATAAVLGWMAVIDAAVWEVEHRYEQARQLKGNHPQP
jgi:hypothetical protein